MATPNRTMSSSHTRPGARLATIAMVGTVYFLLAVVILHFLRPDYDPLSRSFRQYALGKYGFLMTSAYFGLGFGSLALVIDLYQEVSRSWRSTIGLALLSLWGAGILIVAIITTALRYSQRTSLGSLHILAWQLAFVCLVTGIFLLSWHFKNDEKWRSFYCLAMALAGVVFAMAFGTLTTSASAFSGLSQRFLTASCLSWLFLSAYRLHRMNVPRSAPSPADPLAVLFNPETYVRLNRPDPPSNLINAHIYQLVQTMDPEEKKLALARAEAVEGYVRVLKEELSQSLDDSAALPRTKDESSGEDEASAKK